MLQLKIFLIFMLGFFMNCEAGSILREGSLRIIGGEEVNIREYPYQVSVIFNGTHHCGGSIISEKYVLTAAHCLYKRKKFTFFYYKIKRRASDFKIRAGSSFWAKGGVLYDVESVTPHPKFSFHTADYDVGVIRISNTFEINGVTTKIVKLADANNKLAAGDLVRVSGWGRTAYEDPASDILREVLLPIVDHDHCIQLWQGFEIVTENMVCAGQLQPFQSSCKGDSGGPLVDENKVQHGIVSFGDLHCNNQYRPDVYASVASLRSWIKENSGV